jgi:thymidylate synthase (FAD)
MINGYNIEVKLLALTQMLRSNSDTNKEENVSFERLIEYAGRLCWDTTQKIGSDPNRIRKWIEMGHESVIEHASATFYIRSSRVLTHELVRHRIASYSQRSQRYVKENEPRYIIPAEINSDGVEATEIFNKAMDEAWSNYNKLLKLGMKPEIARYVLPNACETQIVMTMNFRELRHFIQLRTSERALPEMRAVAGEVRRILKEKAPEIFYDL